MHDDKTTCASVALRVRHLVGTEVANVTLSGKGRNFPFFKEEKSTVIYIPQKLHSIYLRLRNVG